MNYPNISFDSPVTDLIFDLQTLRDRSISGSTPIWTFLQLKSLFHIVEALSSARIENNHTTLADYVEAQAKQTGLFDEIDNVDEKIKEIINLQKALQFIDENINDCTIDKNFILQLHEIIVDGLKVGPGYEGDPTPGSYRTKNVKISNSNHIPPQHHDILDLMDELFEFMNQEADPKTDLVMIAVAHHEFASIHPFNNGNGRTVRMLTYALLCNNGFIAPNETRLFNPTSVFAGNRDVYYQKLESADSGMNEGILEWTEYVLSGLKVEVEKSLKLADYNFVKDNILIPTIVWAYEKNILSEKEQKIMRILVRKQIIKSADIKDLWPSGTSHVIISRHIRKLRDQNFIEPLKPGGREYIFKFTQNKLTRGLLEQMEKQGMLPLSVDETEKTEPTKKESL